MTITIELPPDMESRLKREAEIAGKELNQFILDSLKRGRKGTIPRCFSPEESTLIHEINRGFPDEFWHRYNELKLKLRDETIEEIERRELIGYADQVEEFSAQRLEALVKLAGLWNLPVKQVMKKLGIQPAKYE